jgi:hypothetical protein
MTDALGKRRLAFPSDVEATLAQNPKAHTIATSCIAFFNQHPSALDTFVRTLKRQGPFSLRLVDWYATNFSRRVRMQIQHNGFLVDLHADYRRHLNVYTKRFFDPFARRERIAVLLLPDNERLLTTVGQMNFLKWMIHKGVDRTVATVKREVEQDMKNAAGAGDKRDDDANAEHNDQYLLLQGPFRLQF